jgi:hypothetical protein
MGEYITKEEWTEAMKRELTPEEKARWEKVTKPLMDMSPEERRKFFQEAKEKYRDEFE